MTEPLVCCVMLTRDRPAMAARAVAAFRAQTYVNKVLVVWDNGDRPAIAARAEWDSIWHVQAKQGSIGTLRNSAIEWCIEGPTPTAPWISMPPLPDIFLHADDDDVSHPNRIAEQVALLQYSDAEIAAYHSLLFVDERDGAVWRYNGYPGDAIGTSLCYWRRTWEERPFPDQNIGEDTEFCKDRRVVSVDGSGDPPMLVARMHHGMTTVRNMERFRNGEDHVFTRIAGPRAEQAREMLR